MTLAQFYEYLSIFGLANLTPSEVNSLYAPVADITALKAIDVTNTGRGTLIFVENPEFIYAYNPTSTITADNYDYVAPNTGLGSWENVYTSPGLQSNQSIYQTAVTLPAPLPKITFLNPQTATVGYTLPALTAANGFKQNDVYIFVNIAAGNQAFLRNSAGTQITNNISGPGIGIFQIASIGTPGTLAAVDYISAMALEAKPVWWSQVAATVLSNIGGLPLTDKAAANGVASLDSGAHLPAAQFPALTGAVTTTAGSLATTIDESKLFSSYVSSLGANLDLRNTTNFPIFPTDIDITFDSSVRDIILSATNASNAAKLGKVTRLKNSSPTGSNRILAQDGTTVIYTIAAGTTIDIALSSAGTTNGTWEIQVFGTAAAQNISAFLQPSNNLSDVSNVATARTNLAAAASATTISPGGRLSGGGDLSANRTLTLNAYDMYQPPITDSSTARTFSPTDACALINFTNAGTVTATIDSDANEAVPNGAFIDLVCSGGSNALLNVTTSAAFNSASGTVINNTKVSVGNGGTIRLKKLGTNSWIVDRIYEEYTHTTSWSGIWASAQAGNMQLVRNGRAILATLPVVTATANAVNSIAMATTLPARFQAPGTIEMRPLVVSNAGATGAGAGTISAGSITIFGTTAYGNFTGSGTGGFFGQNFTYTL